MHGQLKLMARRHCEGARLIKRARIRVPALVLAVCLAADPVLVAVPSLVSRVQSQRHGSWTPDAGHGTQDCFAGQALAAPLVWGHESIAPDSEIYRLHRGAGSPAAAPAAESAPPILDGPIPEEELMLALNLPNAEVLQEAMAERIFESLLDVNEGKYYFKPDLQYSDFIRIHAGESFYRIHDFYRKVDALFYLQFLPHLWFIYTKAGMVSGLRQMFHSSVSQVILGVSEGMRVPSSLRLETIQTLDQLFEHLDTPDFDTQLDSSGVNTKNRMVSIFYGLPTEEKRILVKEALKKIHEDLMYDVRTLKSIRYASGSWEEELNGQLVSRLEAARTNIGRLLKEDQNTEPAAPAPQPGEELLQTVWLAKKDLAKIFPHLNLADWVSNLFYTLSGQPYGWGEASEAYKALYEAGARISFGEEAKARRRIANPEEFLASSDQVIKFYRAIIASVREGLPLVEACMPLLREDGLHRQRLERTIPFAQKVADGLEYLLDEQTTTVDLNDMLEKIAYLAILGYRRFSMEEVQITFGSSSNLLAFLARPDILAFALLGPFLSFRAIKKSGEPVELSLRARVITRQNQSRIVIQIDSSRPMPADYSEDIFSTSLTGITVGLNLTKAIIKSLGGTLRRSHPGSLYRTTITLPAAGPIHRTGQTPPEGPNEAAAPGSDITVNPGPGDPGPPAAPGSVQRKNILGRAA